MSSNSIGKIFSFTTWGESHGRAIGCVIDGVPSNISLNEKDIQIYLDKSSYYWDFYKPSILININGRKSFGIPFKSSSISKIYNYQNETILKNIVKKFKRKNFIDLSHTEEIIFAAKKSYKLKRIIKI